MFEEGTSPNYLPDGYSDDPYHAAKNADESILKNEGTEGERTKIPVDDTTDQPKDPGFGDVMDELNAFKETGDPKNIKHGWLLFIDILKGKSDFKEPLAVGITKVYYKTMGSPESKKAKDILKTQMSRILIFPIGLWVLINWWYLINHTAFTVNILKYAKYVPMPIKPIFEAPLYAIDVLNYYLINMREDSKLSPFLCNILKTIWGWRPVVFFFALMFFSTLYANVDLKDAINVTSGLSSPANGFMFVLSIYAYLYFNICQDRLGYIMQSIGGLPGIVATIVVFILGLVLVLSLCSFGVAFYSLFLIFISFISIFFFTGVNVFSEIGNMFRVINAAPVSNPNATDFFTKMKNTFFQNFLDIMLAVVVIPVMYFQIVETVNGVSNKGMMITMIIFHVILLVTYFKIITYPIMKPIIDMIAKALDDESKKAAAKRQENIKEVSENNPSLTGASSELSNASSMLNGLSGDAPSMMGALQNAPSMMGALQNASSILSAKK
jgi:hypothetical protein